MVVRSALIALALSFACRAQHVLGLTRSIRERSDRWRNAIADNHDHFQSIDRFFEFNDFVDLFDASGRERLTPDCSEGHLNFVGHYSECVQIDVRLSGRERSFAAEYFRIDVDLLLRSNQRNDSCSPVWSFGICLPASCTSAELEGLFIAETATTHSPVCRIHRTNDAIPELDAGFYVTVSIMAAICAVCALTGIADFFLSQYVNGRPIAKSVFWQVIMSFSLYANVGAIFDTSASKKDGQIGAIHCVRFFSMCWVVLGHLAGTIPGLVANPLDIVALTEDLTTEFIINAFFAVDSFFFVGGLLLTFLWFKNFKRNPTQTNSPKAWAMFYVHRFLRLSPPYFMMVLFFTFVFKQFYRNSPVNITLENQSDSCRETWWLEFTYLHNIIDNDNQCLGYSWYLATDFQMFLFSPLIIIPLAFKPVLGLLREWIVAAAIFAISSAVNIFMVYHYHWPASPNLLGATDPEMTGTENYEVYMYYSPVTRCQVYIIGMLAGWLLQTKRRMRINWIINLALWAATLALMLTIILGLHSQMTGELIPIFWRAMYSAFSKPAWALALSWIVISCYYGYGGPINTFMSWRVWVPLGRLSYCGYLIHFPAITRLLPIIALIYFVSIFWSACYEISFGKLEMLLLGGIRSKTLDSERKRFRNDIEVLERSEIRL